MLSRTATFGAKSLVEASWYDDTSATYTSVRPAPTASMHGSPILPTAAAASPAPESTCAASAQTVVLPLVPVTATQRLSFELSRQASSTSLTTSADTAAAAW